MTRKLIVGVGTDRDGWYPHLAEALEAKANQGLPIEYSIVDLNRDDWLELIKPFDIILWKPSFMGPQFAGHFKEKIYTIEKYLNKRIFPNYNTVWHFESKSAQSYLFKNFGISTPQTINSFDYHDAIACLDAIKMPLVFKLPFGGASSNVHLVKTRPEAERRIEAIFCDQLWQEAKKHYGSKPKALLANIFRPWTRALIASKLVYKEHFGVAYWQEFVADNQADLRITVIGDRYAFGFWRNNRPNDFRASGSGNIDYNRPVPKEPIYYCMKISRELGFDSMAYDILFTDDKMVITEISYGYLNRAIYNTEGYYSLDSDGNLSFNQGHTWPETIWVEWALTEANKTLPATAPLGEDH